MHVNDKSIPLATINFPNLSTEAPEATDLRKTMGDLSISALDCTEQGQKVRVKKPAFEDNIEKQEDVAPTLPQKKKKKMPARSKSESANTVLRKLPTHSASGRSSMRRSKTDATHSSLEETGRPKISRQNSFKSSISASIMEGGRPRIRRQNSRSSLGLSLPDQSGRPRVRRENSRSNIRENSRSSIRSATLNKSGRSFSPAPPVRHSSQRRMNRSTKQQERLHKSLSSFLDAQDLSESPEDIFNESFDRASKSCHSTISFTDSFNSHDSGHSKSSHKSQGSKSEKSESKAEPEWNDSFLSQDSHPSLTGSVPCQCDTWSCSCGTSMSDKMRFCGMCGNGKYWTCNKCDFDENISRWGFCGMCGANKLFFKK